MRRGTLRPDPPAFKPARLIYTLLTKGQEYVDAGHGYFEERHRERVLRSLKQRAQQMGLVLMHAEQPV